MAIVCVIFSVWLVWNLLPVLITAPPWFPYVVAVALGIGGMLIIDYHHWWWGIGLAGIANVILLVTDLLLVTTDSLRSQVVTRTSRRG